MRIVAQHWLGRHHGGDATPLALVVALPAREDRATERAGPGELNHSVGDGRAGVEQHAGNLVVPPRNRDLERIFRASEASGTCAQGLDDGDMTIGSCVPDCTAPAVIAYTAPPCASAAQKPSGASCMTCANVIFGAGRASGASLDPKGLEALR